MCGRAFFLWLLEGLVFFVLCDFLFFCGYFAPSCGCGCFLVLWALLLLLLVVACCGGVVLFAVCFVFCSALRCIVE